jgi:hexosaminidase
LPDALNSEERKYILGVQANLWTEYIPTNNKMEYFLFPRALALSEVAWKKKEEKDYGAFIKERLPERLKDLEAQGIFFRIPEANVAISKNATTGRQQVRIDHLVANSLVYYTVDGHKADQTALLYGGPFLAPIPGENQGPLTLRYITVTPGGRASNEFSVVLE